MFVRSRAGEHPCGRPLPEFGAVPLSGGGAGECAALGHGAPSKLGRHYSGYRKANHPVERKDK